MIYWNDIINELVDREGKEIGGMDGAIDSDDAISTSDYTTDEFIRSSRQGMNRYLYRGFYGEDEDSDDLELPKGDKSRWPDGKDDDAPTPTTKGRNATPPSTSKDLEESSKNKMDRVIEDIFTKKQFDTDIVKKFRDNQIRLNGVPPIDTIEDSNPILVRKVNLLKDIIEKNDASGEEKAVILNHLLDIDLTDVPKEYKEELKKKLS
jgi:hypothetical protein